MSEVLGYVWMESSILIRSIDKAIRNLKTRLDKEKQTSMEIAIREYRKRWFRKDRTDEECFVEFLADYNNPDSWDYCYVASEVKELIKEFNKIKDAAEEVTKVLVSVEVVSTIKEWIFKDV